MRHAAGGRRPRAHVDIEVAFLYPWAMALRELGWPGFVQVVLFMALLLAGYVYVWRKGALDWGEEKKA